MRRYGRTLVGQIGEMECPDSGDRIAVTPRSPKTRTDATNAPTESDAEMDEHYGHCNCDQCVSFKENVKGTEEYKKKKALIAIREAQLISDEGLNVENAHVKRMINLSHLCRIKSPPVGYKGQHRKEENV